MATNVGTIVFLLLGILISGATSKKPHIVFILADDLGWTDVGFHGSDQIPTPNLDKLANEGIILGNYYVQPICTPSRSALMTGKYPILTGMFHDVIHPTQPYGLPLKGKLLPEYLKELGYSTHLVGKWHLGFFAKEYTPTYRGFDTFYGFYNGMGDYYNHTRHIHTSHGPPGLDLHDDIEGELKPVWTQAGNYSCDMYGAEAIQRIQNHDATESEKPLFLYMSFQNVHTPLQAPDDWVNKFSYIKDKKRRVFAAMLATMDHSIGQIHKALEKKGILNDTLIIFSSDNGADAKKGFASNYPLRGGKNSLFEGGVRVPGFIHGKLLKKTGHTSMEMMHITDWLPTLVNLAGGETTVDKTLDGVDQWQTLQEGTKSPRSEILLNIDDLNNTIQEALISGQWKIIRDYKLFDTWMIPPGYNSTGKSYSVIECGVKPENITHCRDRYCLFDILNDPCEYNDLSEQHPDIMKKLTDRLDEYRKEMVPFVNKYPDEKSNPKYHGGVWMPWKELQKSSSSSMAQCGYLGFILLFLSSLFY